MTSFLTFRHLPKGCANLKWPLVQYAAEEAIAAGIDTLIFVTGRNKRAIEDLTGIKS